MFNSSCIVLYNLREIKLCYVMLCYVYSYITKNTPEQYTTVCHGCKNHNFQLKNCDFFIIFAQVIDHGYTLEPPGEFCDISPYVYSCQF